MIAEQTSAQVIDACHSRSTRIIYLLKCPHARAIRPRGLFEKVKKMKHQESKLDRNAAAIKRWRTRLKRAMSMLDKLEKQRKRLEAKKPVEEMTKPELLDRLETVPQHFWPPRPTRQDKAELVRAVNEAERTEPKAVDDLSIPSFLRRTPDPVAEQIKSDQEATKRQKAKGRIEKMKAKKRGDLKKMPLSGKAALDLIDNG
jgi:hypothetical protein